MTNHHMKVQLVLFIVLCSTCMYIYMWSDVHVVGLPHVSMANNAIAISASVLLCFGVHSSFLGSTNRVFMLFELHLPLAYYPSHNVHPPLSVPHNLLTQLICHHTQTRSMFFSYISAISALKPPFLWWLRLQIWTSYPSPAICSCLALFSWWRLQ